MRLLTPKKWLETILFLLGLVLLGALVCSLIGPTTLPFSAWTQPDSPAGNILWTARVSRILAALVVGLALGGSGAAFQGLLRNPLADPYILGVSSGAALGGTLALLLRLPFTVVSLFSFGGALASMFLVYALARERGRVEPHTLLLTGVIFNALVFALILMLNLLGNLEQSHQILYLLIGSLEAEPWGRLTLVFILTSGGLILLQRESFALNLLATGGETATTLGISASRHQKRIFFAASLMVGAAVSISGLIGLIGLFVPHIARRLWGADHRLLVLSSALTGALVLMLCDTVTRSLPVAGDYQTELPVGALTALIGAPFFFFLLKRRGVR